jgi:hypothetical protein
LATFPSSTAAVPFLFPSLVLSRVFSSYPILYIFSYHVKFYIYQLMDMMISTELLLPLSSVFELKKRFSVHWILRLCHVNLPMNLF